MAKEPYFPFFTGDWIRDTRHLGLAARGAWIDLLCFMWNAQNRGTITETLEGYARRFGASAEQAMRVIDELTTGDAPVAAREDLEDGRIRVISRRMVRDGQLREIRSTAGKRGGESTAILLKQNGKQNPSKTLDMDMDMVLCPNRGMQGGDGAYTIAVDDDVPDGHGDISDSDWSEMDTEQRVRHWLNKMPRFPLVNTSPKDVSIVAKMTDKWGWDFVKQCIDVALDNDARRPVAYAEKIAESRAAEQFAKSAKAARPKGRWRA